MTKNIITTAGFLGLVAVLLFVLERIVFFSPVISYFNFNTAIILHFFHTVVLLMFAFTSKYIRVSKLRIMYYAFLAGIILASTPLYVIHFMDPAASTEGLLRMVSIVGGGSLIGGWITVVYLGFSYKTKSRR